MKFPMEHRIDRPQPYTHSTATDIRKTFAKARKQIGKQKVAEKVVIEVAEVKVVPTPAGAPAPGRVMQLGRFGGMRYGT